MDNDLPIEISLVRIVEDAESSSLDKRMMSRYAGGRIKVGLGASLQVTPSPDHSMPLQLDLTVTIDYSDTRMMLPRKLLSYTVVSSFVLGGEGVGAIQVEGGTLRLPHHVLTMMLNITIGAMRGMLALRTAGTPLADYPLPMLNVANLALTLTNTAVA